MHTHEACIHTQNEFINLCMEKQKSYILADKHAIIVKKGDNALERVGEGCALNKVHSEACFMETLTCGSWRISKWSVYVERSLDSCSI